MSKLLEEMVDLVLDQSLIIFKVLFDNLVYNFMASSFMMIAYVLHIHSMSICIFYITKMILKGKKASNSI